MSSRIQLKRNTTSGNAPANTDIEEGELAVNIADGNLWVGQTGAAPIVPLVNPTRQLEAAVTYTDGVLPNLPTFGSGGPKIFTSGLLGFEGAPGGQRVVFPTTDGVASQVLTLNATGDALTWTNQAASINRFYNIPLGTGGDLFEDFNEVDWTGTDNEGSVTATAFEVRPGETIYLAFERDGNNYIFGGVPGTEYGLGGTPLTDNSLFISLGAGTPFATQTDFNGSVAGVAVDPQLGNVNYLTKSATGDGGALQTLAGAGGYAVAPTVDLTIGTASADTGVFAVNRDSTIGAVGNAVGVTMVGTLTGVDVDTVGSELILDEAVLDGGVY